MSLDLQQMGLCLSGRPSAELHMRAKQAALCCWSNWSAHAFDTTGRIWESQRLSGRVAWRVINSALHALQALQEACPESPWSLTFSYGRALQSATLKARRQTAGSLSLKNSQNAVVAQSHG